MESITGADMAASFAAMGDSGTSTATESNAGGDKSPAVTETKTSTATDTEPAQSTATPAATEQASEPAVDWKKRYDDSSRSAREMSARLKQLEQMVQAQQQAAPKPAPPAPKYAYNTPEEYNEALQKDWRGAQRTLVKDLLGSDPELLRELVSPILQERLAPLTEREQQMRSATHAQEAFAAHPEFAPGTPGHEAAQRFIEENPALGSALFKAYQESEGGFNVHLVIGQLGAYQTLKAQLDGAKKQQDVRQKSAGTARPSTGGATAPKTDTIESKSRSIASNVGVPAEFADQMSKALRGALGK